MNYGVVDSVPTCESAPKQPSMKGIVQDTNKCLQECVLSLIDFREVLCGHGREPEKLPESQCLLDDVMSCNAQSHRLLDIIKEIQAVMM